MIPTTANYEHKLRRLEAEAMEVRQNTRTIELEGGPFDGQTARIKQSNAHFASTVPETVAKEYPPIEFDGVPNVPEQLAFLAYYSKKRENVYAFEEIKVYKRSRPNMEYPFGYERV